MSKMIASMAVGSWAMSKSHKNENRSLSELYFRFHCIIITGYDRICGSDTQEELWVSTDLAWNDTVFCVLLVNDLS